jgi:hypothetical protein
MPSNTPTYPTPGSATASVRSSPQTAASEKRPGQMVIASWWKNDRDHDPDGPLPYIRVLSVRVVHDRDNLVSGLVVRVSGSWVWATARSASASPLPAIGAQADFDNETRNIRPPKGPLSRVSGPATPEPISDLIPSRSRIAAADVGASLPLSYARLAFRSDPVLSCCLSNHAASRSTRR